MTEVRQDAERSLEAQVCCGTVRGLVLRCWGMRVYNEGVSRHGKILKTVWTRYGENRMAPLNILREAEADGLSFVHYSFL